MDKSILAEFWWNVYKFRRWFGLILAGTNLLLFFLYFCGQRNTAVIHTKNLREKNNLWLRANSKEQHEMFFLQGFSGHDQKF